ncbi:MAG: heavy metal-associated domain-containing protein [Candidatus Methanomethylophilaceae archaeon]|jgi:copper chaperone|nr:heavy metal-associated domain-containing protein [Candidatus Methanomethylophilaceae archaeon]NCA73284.1 heavy-metal-associated domain-containing protein [Gammaproteobacteria bacterium]MDD2935794.1 heavy metal-associated domain-containing protein [Candidatus Methanomethylophilaceae archaeon]MDD3350934.1 heavy metal-associated domain-containing protein [Candidatus Methanomethylophilaceae archaeon]MDD3986578.1 heavy metal-associated domain-containing protein [Candidatus Methanomethylophilaceae
MARTILKIQGMTCEMCSKKAEESLRAVRGVSEVSIDLKKGLATVVHGEVAEKDLVRAVVDAGYRAEVRRGLFG